MNKKLWIAHHGIKGMHWGIKNGPPYPLDSSKSTGSVLKKKPSQKRVFVSGSSKTQDKSSEYYLRKLPKSIRKELDKRIENNDIIVVGDAPGIDRQVQDYLKKRHYKNVEVYSPGNKPRYLKNKKWKNVLVDSSEFEEGSPDWLAKKDKLMAKNADEAIAVILPKGSQATRNNIRRLLDENKEVSVYQLSVSKYVRKGEDGARKTIGVKAMSLSDDPKKDFPGLSKLKDPEEYFTKLNDDKNNKEYYELQKHIENKSGDWYSGKYVSEGFRKNREEANKIGKEMYELTNRMWPRSLSKNRDSNLERAKDYDSLLKEYNKLEKKSRKLNNDLLGIVLKDIGYEDNEFNRKFIKRVVFYD